MEIKIVAFGIAKDIIQGSTGSLVIENNSNISDLKKRLIEQYPEFSDLRSIRFAVNEEYQDDQFLLNPEDEVVIIPPVSGG